MKGTDDIIPCGVCGRTPGDWNWHDKGAHLVCGCGVSGPAEPGATFFEDCIPAWNRMWGRDDESETHGEQRCSTHSPSTVVPPDQETWDILCAYLASEEDHGGAGISEGRLAEILKDRNGWCRDETRAAWFDAVKRGNALIEADHERKRPLIEARIQEMKARLASSSKDGSPTGRPSSSDETSSGRPFGSPAENG